MCNVAIVFRCSIKTNKWRRTAFSQNYDYHHQTSRQFTKMKNALRLNKRQTPRVLSNARPAFTWSIHTLNKIFSYEISSSNDLRHWGTKSDALKLRKITKRTAAHIISKRISFASHYCHTFRSWSRISFVEYYLKIHSTKSTTKDENWSASCALSLYMCSVAAIINMWSVQCALNMHTICFL